MQDGLPASVHPHACPPPHGNDSFCPKMASAAEKGSHSYTSRKQKRYDRAHTSLAHTPVGGGVGWTALSIGPCWTAAPLLFWGVAAARVKRLSEGGSLDKRTSNESIHWAAVCIDVAAMPRPTASGCAAAILHTSPNNLTSWFDFPKLEENTRYAY